MSRSVHDFELPNVAAGPDPFSLSGAAAVHEGSMPGDRPEVQDFLAAVGDLDDVER